MVTAKYQHIPGVLKRGLWQYSPAEEAVRLDNGNEYNLTEMQALIQAKGELMKGRKAAMEYKATAEAD